jgi:hypothetical protein
VSDDWSRDVIRSAVFITGDPSPILSHMGVEEIAAQIEDTLDATRDAGVSVEDVFVHVPKATSSDDPAYAMVRPRAISALLTVPSLCLADYEDDDDD